MLTWKVPYWDKSTDIIVLMSIMNGELPKTPHNSTDSPYYTVLWRLCQSCWTERACRPSAEEISTLIQTCYDLEVAKLVQVQASDELKRSINNPETYKMEGQAWHLQFEKTFPPASWSNGRAHQCFARIEDGKVTFACERDLILGPILSVELHTR